MKDYKGFLRREYLSEADENGGDRRVRLGAGGGGEVDETEPRGRHKARGCGRRQPGGEGREGGGAVLEAHCDRPGLLRLCGGWVEDAHYGKVKRAPSVPAPETEPFPQKERAPWTLLLLCPRGRSFKDAYCM